MQKIRKLEKQEIDWLSVVWMHVEHVIGLLKQTYTILQIVLTRTIISSDDDNANSAMNKIVRVYCACIDLCPSVMVVPQE